MAELKPPTDLAHQPMPDSPLQSARNQFARQAVNQSRPTVGSERIQLIDVLRHERDLLGGGNFRVDLGLTETVDRSSATEIRYGIKVTAAEAAFLDNNMRLRASVDTVKIDETLERDHADEYLDSIWSPSSGRVEVYVRRSGDSGAARAAVESTLARAVDTEPVVVEVESIDRSGLDAARIGIVEQFAKTRPGVSIGLTLDETCEDRRSCREQGRY